MQPMNNHTYAVIMGFASKYKYPTVTETGEVDESYGAIANNVLKAIHPELHCKLVKTDVCIKPWFPQQDVIFVLYHWLEIDAIIAYFEQMVKQPVIYSNEK